MKTLLLTAATAALILAAPAAFADPNGGPNDNNKDKHTQHDNSGTPNNTMMGGPSDKHHHDMTTPPTGSGNPDKGHDFKNHDHDNSGHDRDNANHDHNNSGHDHDNFGRNGNHGTNVHLTINFNRRNVTAQHHFHYHGGAYRWPGNYHYQRWSFGMTLPNVFWARDYWVDDYGSYGLSAPPDGAVWVRYGNDAILIDENTGNILEVVYGQFY